MYPKDDVVPPRPFVMVRVGQTDVSVQTQTRTIIYQSLLFLPFLYMFISKIQCCDCCVAPPLIFSDCIVFREVVGGQARGIGPGVD